MLGVLVGLVLAPILGVGLGIGWGGLLFVLRSEGAVLEVLRVLGYAVTYGVGAHVGARIAWRWGAPSPLAAAGVGAAGLVVLTGGYEVLAVLDVVAAELSLAGHAQRLGPIVGALVGALVLVRWPPRAGRM